MNKTIKAFRKGFIFFQVNDHFFLTYNGANAFCTALQTYDGDIFFQGFNLFTMRWECFYMKAVSPLTINGLFKQVT